MAIWLYPPWPCTPHPLWPYRIWPFPRPEPLAVIGMLGVSFDGVLLPVPIPASVPILSETILDSVVEPSIIYVTCGLDCVTCPLLVSLVGYIGVGNTLCDRSPPVLFVRSISTLASLRCYSWDQSESDWSLVSLTGLVGDQNCPHTLSVSLG